MQELSTDLIRKLKKKGINTFFGVIGGACTVSLHNFLIFLFL